MFDLIDTFTTFVVERCLEKKAKVSVEEVLKNMLINLLKIYRKCFLMMEEHRDFLCQRVGRFFNLVERLLQFRQSDVYQWTLKQVREMLNAGSDLALNTT